MTLKLVRHKYFNILLFMALCMPLVSFAASKDYSLTLSLVSDNSVRASWKISRSYSKLLKKICLQREVNGRFVSLSCAAPKVLTRTILDSVIDEYDVTYRLILTKSKSAVKITKSISLPLPDDSSNDDSSSGGANDGNNGGGGDVSFQSACPPGFADFVIRDTNAVRASMGLSSLTYNSRLAWGADMHSRFMAETQTLTHDGWSDRIIHAGYSFSSIGQNVAFTQGASFDSSLISLWMESPGHRENIVNPRWIHIGVSCSYSSNGFMYWTQNFGKP